MAALSMEILSMRRKRPWLLHARRAFMGRFVHKVTDRTKKGIRITVDNSHWVVVPLFLELGDNPFVEEIRMTFSLETSCPPDIKIFWLAPDSPKFEVEIETCDENRHDSTSQARLMFTFSAELSVDDNFAELDRFVTENAADLLNPPRNRGSSRMAGPTA